MNRYVVLHDAISGGFVRGDVISGPALGDDAVGRLLGLGAIREATKTEAGQVHVELPVLKRRPASGGMADVAEVQARDAEIVRLNGRVKKLEFDLANARRELQMAGLLAL